MDNLIGLLALWAMYTVYSCESLKARVRELERKNASVNGSSGS